MHPDFSPLWIAGGESMEPAIRNGDLLLVVPPIHVGPGSVVIYRNLRSGRPVVHRVVDRGPEGWVTRGDNLPRPDPAMVTPGEIIGLVLGRIPRAGTLLAGLRRHGPAGTPAALRHEPPGTGGDTDG